MDTDLCETAKKGGNGTPFDGAQDKPFDGAQGRPFDGAQDRPFDTAQDKQIGGDERRFGRAKGEPGEPCRGGEWT
jgi:hypothetical protein